jgi:hypothetical protein
MMWVGGRYLCKTSKSSFDMGGSKLNHVRVRLYLCCVVAILGLITSLCSKGEHHAKVL